VENRETLYCSVEEVVFQGLSPQKENRVMSHKSSFKQRVSRERKLNLLKIFFSYFGLVEHGRTFLFGPIGYFTAVTPMRLSQC